MASLGFRFDPRGRLIEPDARSCTGKNRYTSEYIARATGQFRLNDERPGHAAETQTLWPYPCQLCRGWHLTKQLQANVAPITAASMYGMGG